jgi:hypothetical protein
MVHLVQANECVNRWDDCNKLTSVVAHLSVTGDGGADWAVLSDDQQKGVDGGEKRSGLSSLSCTEFALLMVDTFKNTSLECTLYSYIQISRP